MLSQERNQLPEADLIEKRLSRLCIDDLMEELCRGRE